MFFVSRHAWHSPAHYDSKVSTAHGASIGDIFMSYFRRIRARIEREGLKYITEDYISNRQLSDGRGDKRLR